MIAGRHKSYALLKLRLPRQPEQDRRDISLELQLVGDAADRQFFLPQSTTDSQSVVTSTYQPEDVPSTSSDNVPTVSIGRWRVSASDVGLPSDPKLDFPWLHLLPPLMGPVTNVVIKWASYIRENLGDYLSDSLSQLSLPNRVLRSMKNALARVLDEKEPLWLQIAQPSGYLSMIPWESVLLANLDRPLLRMPRNAPAPLESSGMQEVVMCISSPGTVMAPKMLRELIVSVGEELPKGSRVHIFPDGQHFPGLKKVLPACAAETNLHLYDPSQSPSPAPPSEEKDDSAIEVRRRWTKWIRSELGGDGVDMFHFVAPVWRFFGGARLRLVREPRIEAKDKNTTRLVTPQEVGDFMTTLGAWSVMLSCPEPKSRFGMQLFAEQLATLRPGPLGVHDLQQDQGNSAIRHAYRFLLRGESEPPQNQAISLYYHPSWLGTDTVDVRNLDLRTSYHRARERCRAVLDLPGPAPSWVTSRQRFFEEAVTGYTSREPQSDLEAAALRGLRKVLDDLSEDLPSPSQLPTKEGSK